MSRLFQKLSTLAVVAAAFLATACADSPAPTAPAASLPAVRAQGAPPPSAGLLTDLTSTVTQPIGNVVTILGKLPQLTDISVSAVIGRNGGQLSIPQTGLTLIVPPGAVSSNVTFRVTALHGLSVAYEFEPHGMVFDKPLSFVQDLNKTLYVPGLRLNGAYFKDRDQLDLIHRTGTVDETIQSLLNLTGRKVEFPIRHFSGYLVSCA